MAGRFETVKAAPVKRFFIDIITRDIDLVAAILDLVDNAVDSATDLRPDGRFDGLGIEIVATPSEFSIVDNCKGIEIDDAREYVFRFGRPSDVEGLEGSIGQFGVGMKRALFKLGWSFTVDSITDHSHFTVELNVREWQKTADWHFDMQVHDESDRSLEPGTTILVDQLHSSISSALGRDEVLGALRENLKSKHRLAMENGLRLTLNGQSLMPIPSELAISDQIQPYIKRFTLPSNGDVEVAVEIYAGVAAKGATGEDSAPEDSKEAAANAGWHVFGNSRLLLAADRTSVTGWGGTGNLPLFHNQYGRFRGFVFMYSTDSSALPWNTTKTGVDASDPLWVRIRGEMITAGRTVITLLNHLKNERVGENRELDTPITKALEYSSPVALGTLRVQGSDQDLLYPEPNPDLELGSRMKKIAYSVTPDAFELVSEEVGEKTAAKVGKATFEYFYAREIGEV